MLCKVGRLSATKHTRICRVVHIVTLFQLLGSLLAEDKMQEQRFSFASIKLKCSLVGTGLWYDLIEIDLR